MLLRFLFLFFGGYLCFCFFQTKFPVWGLVQGLDITHIFLYMELL